MITVQEGVKYLLEGGIVSYPTEGVYGLGVDALNMKAVERLCLLKERSMSKGLIVLVNNLCVVEKWVIPLNEHEQKKFYQKNNGYHFTWVVPVSKDCPDYLSGSHNTLAIRLTSHPVAHELCALLKRPLISTSANLQGQEAALTASTVEKYFNDQISGIVQGNVGCLGSATRIQDIKTDQVYRI